MKKINSYRVIQNDNGTWGVVGITGVKEEFLFNIDDIGGNVTNNELIERTELEFKVRGIEIDKENINVEFNEDMTTIRRLMRVALNTLDDKSTTKEEKMKELPIIQGECLVSQTILKTYSLEIQRKQVGIKVKGIKNG